MRFQRLLLALCALALVAAACSSDGGDPPELADPAATAEELVNHFLQIVAANDTEALDEFLLDSYLVQRADGTGADKAEVLDTTYELSDWVIGDPVIAAQDGEVLSVRWTLEVDESIDGQEFTSSTLPRLSVFVWDRDQEAWRMAAHANFNSPA